MAIFAWDFIWKNSLMTSKNIETMILKSDALGNWPVLVCSLISKRNISPENDGKVGLELNWGCWTLVSC